MYVEHACHRLRICDFRRSNSIFPLRCAFTWTSKPVFSRVALYARAVYTMSVCPSITLIHSIEHSKTFIKTFFNSYVVCKFNRCNHNKRPMNCWTADYSSSEMTSDIGSVACVWTLRIAVWPLCHSLSLYLKHETPMKGRSLYETLSYTGSWHCWWPWVPYKGHINFSRATSQKFSIWHIYDYNCNDRTVRIFFWN